MSPSDQIQDLFDRALSSVPVQPVPSTRVLYERLNRHRVRTRFSALRDAVGVAFSPRVRQTRLHRGRLYPSLAVAALAVVALVAGLVIVGSKNSSGPRSPSTLSGARSFRLLDMSANPFRSLSPGATASLQCVTALVCYSPGTSQNNFFRTTNGGLNWEETASLPPTTGEPGWSMLSFSCATVQNCALVYVAANPATTGQLAQFIFTTDGGAHWNSSAIPVPTGVPNPSASRFACGDATHCLLSVTGTAPNSTSQRVGTFLSTSDAGATWTQARSVPSVLAGAVWTLNCSADGSCLTISALGSHPKSFVVGLRSDDWGLTWFDGAPDVYNSAAVLYVSCGDTTHCMLVPVAYPSKVPYEIATTSNAGVTWRVSDPPVGWQNMPTAVSCANANDCWIATSTYDAQSPAGVYSHPAVEATHDGGTTWSSVGLPSVTPPNADVLTLSCPPSGDGCIGVGNLRDHMLPPSKSGPPS
jgi:hypothetical protein